MRRFWQQCSNRIRRFLGGPRPARPVRRVRPTVELLEERAVPATFNVNSLADLSIAGGVNPSTGAITGQGRTVTLRSAIDAANISAGPNTIRLLVPGTYSIMLPGANTGTDLTGAFCILPTGGDLTIINASRGAITVNGNHLDRVFDVNPNFDAANPTTPFTVTLQGFTITGGVASPGDGAEGSGGGVRDQGNASLTLNQVVVTGNEATADGGGISMENIASVPWKLTVNNSTISDNHAGDAGGGIDEDGSGKVFVTSSTISNNTCVNQGGGIWLDAVVVGADLQTAALTVTGTVVSGNDALDGPGGGIGQAGNSTVTLVSTTLANNAAGMMGGGFGDQNGFGSLVVADSLVVNNTAVGAGGGLQESGPITSISSTLIAGNASGAGGGGVFAAGTTLSIDASTIANNTAAGGDNMTTQGGGGIELQTTGSGLAASTITNTTITGNQALNSAGVDGGGVDALALTGDLVLLNDTLNANFADTGGGIAAGGTAGTVALQNTIVAGNTARLGVDLAGTNPFTDRGGNLIGVAGDDNAGFTAATTQIGTVASPLNSLLAPLGNYGGPLVGAPGTTHALLTEAVESASPALDKGLLTQAPAYDERGRLHVFGSGINVGAVSATVTPAAAPTAVHVHGSLVVQKTSNNVQTTYYYVNSTLDTHTPAAGTLTLRAALDMANQAAGNKVIELLVPGVYGITLPGANTDTNESGAFAILSSGGNVTITNASHGAVTVDGNGLDRVFDINPTNDVNLNDEFTVTLQGFTITGGVAASGDGGAGSGGGIRAQGIANLTLNNMIITNNLATADGGGLSMENTVSAHWLLTINNSGIRDNHAGDAGGGVEEDGSSKVFINAGTVIAGNTCVNQGAGIWLDAIENASNVLESSALTVTGALIEDNAALTMLGGGIGNAGDGPVTINNSTLSANFAGGTGGGFADAGNLGALTVNNSLFQRNFAVGSGGAIQEGGPATRSTNSEFISNASGMAGGGIFANGSTLSLLRSTIADNVAAGDGNGNGGGGLELQTTGAVTVTTTTVSGNDAVNNAGANGGGIDAGAAFTGSLGLLNDTINGNLATNGGGIFGAGNTANPSVQNTIIAANFITADGTGVDANGTFTDKGGNLIGVGGDANNFMRTATTQAGTLAQPVNPLLAALGYYGGPKVGAPAALLGLETEALLHGSPAHGKGLKAGAPTTDERGMPIASPVSVGAVDD